jgi:chaperone required for assembly of F1-ATPase
MSKPFKKGDPRINRKGRPKKGQTVTDALREFMNQPHEKGRTRIDELVESLWYRAGMNSDLAAIKYIFDRLDGRIPETPRKEETINPATEAALAAIFNRERNA